jgi:hypothetical protein
MGASTGLRSARKDSRSSTSEYAPPLRLAGSVAAQRRTPGAESKDAFVRVPALPSTQLRSPDVVVRERLQQESAAKQESEAAFRKYTESPEFTSEKVRSAEMARRQEIAKMRTAELEKEYQKEKSSQQLLAGRAPQRAGNPLFERQFMGR